MLLFALMALFLGQSAHPQEAAPVAAVKVESGVAQEAIGIIKITEKIECPDEIIQKITTFSEDPFIKGILLVIDSGGGAIGSSELIFREMKELSRQKPIVTLVINSCCSGAYWIALASDWIVAQASSDVGSIGVKYIVQKYKSYKQTDQGYTADVDISVTCAGKFKGLSDPRTAPMNEEEKAFVTTYTDNLYDIFTEYVAQERGARGLTKEKKSEWADGKEFTGKQALQIGLVDQLGCRSDAVKKLKELIKDRGIQVTQKLVFVE